MCAAPLTDVTVEEGIPLQTVPGSGGDAQEVQGAGGRVTAFCCNDPNHRKLAKCSIVCGISCIGMKALENSVKAETARNPQEAVVFTKQAKKFAVTSIAIWVTILALTPILMALFSYLLTLAD